MHRTQCDGASPRAGDFSFLSLLGSKLAPLPTPPLPGAGRAHATRRCLDCIYVTSEFSFSGSLSGIARLRGSRKVVNPIEWHRGYGLSHQNTTVLCVL